MPSSQAVTAGILYQHGPEGQLLILQAEECGQHLPDFPECNCAQEITTSTSSFNKAPVSAQLICNKSAIVVVKLKK
jgi:hypothetical protein